VGGGVGVVGAKNSQVRSCRSLEFHCGQKNHTFTNHILCAARSQPVVRVVAGQEKVGRGWSSTNSA